MTDVEYPNPIFRMCKNQRLPLNDLSNKSASLKCAPKIKKMHFMKPNKNVQLENNLRDSSFSAGLKRKSIKTVSTKLKYNLDAKTMEKVNRLSQGLPTYNSIYQATNSGNSQKQETAIFPFQFSFFSYFYPSEIDEALIPLQHNLCSNTTISPSNSMDDSESHEDRNRNRLDRRIKMVERKCKVTIKIGKLEPKLIRSLPRRRITFFAHEAERIPTALTCLEEVMPEIFEKALFVETLNCKTLKWPNSKSLFTTNFKRSKRNQTHSLNYPIWSRNIDPVKVFPFSAYSRKSESFGPENCNHSNILDEEVNCDALNKNYNSINIVNVNSTDSSKSPNKQSVTNNEVSSCSLQLAHETESNEHQKYLKFPLNNDSRTLFEFNDVGQPINKKLLEFLKVSKCKIDNIKRRTSKIGDTFYYVKTRYESPDQLVKLFLLLRYKVKY